MDNNGYYSSDFASIDVLEMSRQPATHSESSFRQYCRFSLGPDWRWREAQRIVERRKISTKADHGHVIWQLIRHLSGGRFSCPDEKLGLTKVEIEQVVAIHQSPDRRMELEARILARMNPIEVGQAMKLEPSVVRDYCDVYFDVLDQLQASHWIYPYIIDLKSVENSCLRRFLYRYAYAGGAHVCEHFLKQIQYLGEDHDLTTFEGREREQTELVLKLEELCDGGMSNEDGEKLRKHAMILESLNKGTRDGQMLISQGYAAQVSKVLRTMAESSQEVAGVVGAATNEADKISKPRTA